MDRGRVTGRLAALVAVVAALAFWTAAPAQTSKKVQRSAQPSQSHHFKQLAPLHGVISVDWGASGTRTTTDASGTLTNSYDGHLSLRVSVDGTAGEKNGYYWQRGDVQLDFRERAHQVVTPKQGPEMTIDETVELIGPAEPLGIPGDGKATSVLNGQLYPDGKEATLLLDVRARMRTTTRISGPVRPGTEVKESSFGFRLSSGHETSDRDPFHAPAVKQGSDVSLDGHLSEATIGRWGTAYASFIASGPARDMVARLAEMGPLFPSAPWEGTISISWHLTTQDFELVVDPVDYASWIPEGGKDDDTPGNSLEVAVRLQKSDGSLSEQKAKQFIFELAKTSKMPGVCMNYPPETPPGEREKPPRPDLRFSSAKNRSLEVVEPDGQMARTRAGEENRSEAKAVVSAFDWGGWSELKVTALMPDGRRVEGHLKDHPGARVILLPKRAEDSRIADAWKEKRRVEGLKDNDDSETDPKGGDEGDGLSLYEEYRGFYENNRHIYGDPKRKDFFIYDETGEPRTRDGISLFAAVTGLAVHGKLRSTELDIERVVNFHNSMDSLHVTAQHGVIIRSDPGLGASSSADGGPGRPGDIKQIRIGTVDPGPDGWNRVRDGKAEIITDEYAATVAHELLHACNVDHHGEGDPKWMLWSAVKVDGGWAVAEFSLDEHGNPIMPIDGFDLITIKTEYGVEVLPDYVRKSRKVYVGKEGGQHSGFQNCLMRYAAAGAYVARDNKTVRYLTKEETGIQICEDAKGTGVNDPDRKTPQPRFGNAALGRGNCRGQLRVNDLKP